jgi:integrase
MSVYKRGKVYWYGFTFCGQYVQSSTHQGNRNKARTMQDAHRTRIAGEQKEREDKAAKLGVRPEELRHCSECERLFNGANPITVTAADSERVFCCEECERKWRSRQSPTPTFEAFAKRFAEEMESVHAGVPDTQDYYSNGLIALKAFFGDMRLDRIEEEQVAAFIAKRRVMKKRGGKTIKIATVNRELEVLRHALRLAQEWKIINRVPKISRQPGEVGRERVLSHAEEQAYLAVAKQPLRDIATALVDGGFRPEELFRARWENVHFQPAGKALYGYIHNPYGKNKYAKRNISMTARVWALLEMRFEEQGKPSEGWVFPAETKSGHIDRVKSQHAKALKDSGVKPFVIYSLRHTMLTRLGEAGADAFAIQKIAGHSDIRTSARYVHPTPEKIEGAFTQLAEYNLKKEAELLAEQERGLVQ